MTTKYEKLDAMLLNRIKEGHSKFASIYLAEVRIECERVAEAEGTRRSPYGVDPFRICDRRPQALRKAGKISFNGSGEGMGWVRIGEQQ